MCQDFFIAQRYFLLDFLFCLCFNEFRKCRG
nr:MAG TPA: hypothetical protein [Caudoviricetes sp.]